MKPRYRITILIILAIIFFTASPVLILWTLGYRYNPKKHNIEKTGLLYVNTDPKGADIYLDTKKQDGQTPLRIKYLLTGDHLLRIEKTDYIPYEKKVYIESGLATFVDNVMLIKQNLPVLMSSEEIKNTIIINKDIIYLIENKISETKMTTKEAAAFLTPDYQNYIFLKTVNSYTIFKNRSNIKLLMFDADKKIIFDDYGKEIIFGENENEFAVYDDFEINLYNIKDKQKYFISRSSKKIKNVFLLEGNYIIYILEDGAYITEKWADKAERVTLELCKFSGIYSAALDKEQKNLYILGEINDKKGIYKLNFR